MVDVVANIPFTYVREGTYYFQRYVPVDLIQYYKKNKVVVCLKTKSVRYAKVSARSIAAKLEDYWFSLRLKNIDAQLEQFVIDEPNLTHPNCITIDEALALYLKLKSTNKSKTFKSTSVRDVSYLKKCLGLRQLNQYTKKDANSFRDWLLQRKLSSSSVKRIFSSIKAIINFAIQENDIDVKNVFINVYMPDNKDVKKRIPISLPNIKKIQSACKVINDDIRWLVALISDTGMRLSEATGLSIDDLVLDTEIPHVIVQPHSWRRLKTNCSERKIPLVGASLWSAHKIKKNPSSSFCFPRYTSDKSCNANSASAALNKWIKAIGSSTDVIHAFRHSFRDRLRSASVQSDLIDQLGGWSQNSIGLGYGDGYTLDMSNEAIKKIIIN